MTIRPEDVLNRKLGKLYIHYLIPMLFANLMGSLYGFADLYFIGNGVGGTALAALSIATPMYCIFSCLTCLIGSGAATAMAVCTGEGDWDEANQYFTQSMLLLVGIGVALTVVFQIFLGPIARFLGADDSLLPQVEAYMRIVTLATPGFLISWSLGSFVRNDGNPGLVMWASIVPNCFNILFDYVFVYPLKMGIQGVALATALSPILGTLLLCMHFLFKKNKIRLVKPHFSLHRLWRIIRNGASYCVQEFSGAVLIFTFNTILMAKGGAVAVSAYAVVMNVGWIAMSMISGFIGGAQPIIGICVGGGRYDRVRGAFRMAMGWSGLFTVLVTALLLWQPGLVGSLFAGGDLAVEAAAEHAGLLYYWGVLPSAINIAVLGLAQASEWYRQALMITLSRSLVVLLGCLLLLSSLFGITGAWLAFPVAEVLTLVLSVLIYIALRRDFRAKEQLFKLAEKIQ